MSYARLFQSTTPSEIRWISSENHLTNLSLCCTILRSSSFNFKVKLPASWDPQSRSRWPRELQSHQYNFLRNQPNSIKMFQMIALPLKKLGVVCFLVLTTCFIAFLDGEKKVLQSATSQKILCTESLIEHAKMRWSADRVLGNVFLTHTWI